MSILFSNLVKQALKTFEKSNIESLKSNFIILKQLIDQININDINLDLNLINDENFQKISKAPCTFVKIFQNDYIAMSVFVLKNGYTMPLHDHPMMTGFLKAISGTLMIQSYSKKFRHNDDEKEIYNSQAEYEDVIVEPTITINHESEAVTLTPREKNFHEITAINGVAAFFDILSPPYEAKIPIYGERECNFYRKLILTKNLDSNTDEDETAEHQQSLQALKAMDVIRLKKIPSPSSYYCDTGYYEQPEFLSEYNTNGGDMSASEYIKPSKSSS